MASEKGSDLRRSITDLSGKVLWRASAAPGKITHGEPGLAARC